MQNKSLQHFPHPLMGDFFCQRGLLNLQFDSKYGKTDKDASSIMGGNSFGKERDYGKNFFIRNLRHERV